MALAEALLQRPMWVPDVEVRNCMGCNKTFGATVRRHHCRVCGHVFCKKCCGTKLHIPSMGYTTPQKVCSNCRGSAPSVVGQKVQVLCDVTKVKYFCDEAPYLPPWDPRKASFCGCIGIVEAQDPRDGSSKVVFPNGPFSWYPPKCLELAPRNTRTPLPTEVETRVVVLCCDKPHLEGAYARAPHKYNGVSVWCMSQYRIYSNKEGRWAVTNSEQGMAREQGSIRSVKPHGGKLHPYAMEDWETYKGGEWWPISSFKVVKAVVPVGSAPCVNTTVVQNSVTRTVDVPSERVLSEPQRSVDQPVPHISGTPPPQQTAMPVQTTGEVPGLEQALEQTALEEARAMRDEMEKLEEAADALEEQQEIANFDAALIPQKEDSGMLEDLTKGMSHDAEEPLESDEHETKPLLEVKEVCETEATPVAEAQEVIEIAD
eukprot:TRINITY_DN10278_c0_g2_i2.p1 TRINITY_DN10278_c0_g2~~TRINITY_DN10278_c0_g2_i2.p1  ORF type:complete len:451 (+),score=96.46 TRINITY_DN10278_c0_g2_i2:66-1355(+)